MRLIFTGILLLFLFSCSHDPAAFDETEWQKKVEAQRTEDLYAPHFKDGEFFNPWMPMAHAGFIRLLRWKLSSSARYTEEERAHRPDFVQGLKERIRSHPPGDFIAWIGHGTFLMRLNGAYWLTDPMFSERALIPKRVTPPAITGEELNDLAGDLNVIVSHNHHDHLDKKSIRSLPAKAAFFVPLGIKQVVETIHGGKIEEMDWWDGIDAGNGTKIICVPAQHWSRRLGQDTNGTLWASFILISPGATIYFGGDSGYFVGYRELGKRFPKIDYALMPTTAYHPRWFMHYAHLNIEEAVRAFQSLGAGYFIPTQWGAFHLGDEPPGYPALDLRRTIREMGLDPSRFLIMDIGEIHSIK